MTKGRWRVLIKRLDEDSDRIPDTMIACCVLHNICVLRGDEIDKDDSDDDDSRLQLRVYKLLFNTLQINRKVFPCFCPLCVLNYRRLRQNSILLCNLFK